MAREAFGDENSEQSPSQLLTRFSHANAIALGHLSETTAAEDLDKAIQILSQAHAAHVVGVRRAFVVASYFAYALRHIDRKAYLIDGVGGMYKEQASALDKNDVMIAVSFHSLCGRNANGGKSGSREKSASDCDHR